VTSRNIWNIASPLQTSQSGFLRSLCEETLAIRDLGNGPKSSNYLDWIRNWRREHKLGTRHYVRHGIFLFMHSDVWAYDDAGGSKVELMWHNISDHDPQEIKKVVPSTILPSTQSTGFASPQKIYPPTFDTIRRLYGEQDPAHLVRFKMERFPSEIDRESTPPPRHHV
jgi:hypothetical protein